MGEGLGDILVTAGTGSGIDITAFFMAALIWLMRMMDKQEDACDHHKAGSGEAQQHCYPAPGITVRGLRRSISLLRVRIRCSEFFASLPSHQPSSSAQKR